MKKQNPVTDPCLSCGIKGARKPKGARCCNYVTIRIKPPTEEEDWEELRWIVAHGGATVYMIREGSRESWYVHLESRCRFLRAGNVCEIYHARPDPCRAYSNHDCEGVTGERGADLELKTIQDVEKYADAALRLRHLGEQITDPSEAPKSHRDARFLMDGDDG